MTWGRGLFRVWIVLSLLWCLLVGLFMWQHISNPYISWGGFKMAQGEPEYLELYGEKMRAARELKRRNLLVEYEIEWEGLRTTSLFFPSAAVEDQNLTAIKAFMPKAAALQKAMTSSKRNENIWKAVSAAFLPPAVILALGLAVRWALMGFRPHTAA